MAIFNSYVSLPEGKPCNNLQQVGVMGYIPDMFWHVLACFGHEGDFTSKNVR